VRHNHGLALRTPRVHHHQRDGDKALGLWVGRSPPLQAGRGVAHHKIRVERERKNGRAKNISTRWRGPVVPVADSVAPFPPGRPPSGDQSTYRKARRSGVTNSSRATREVTRLSTRSSACYYGADLAALSGRRDGRSPRRWTEQHWMHGFQHLAKVRVAGSNPVVRSRWRVRRIGAPAAPSRCLGASSLDHRGGSDGKPPGQLDRLSCLRRGQRSGVILGRGLEPQQLGQLASCISPVVTRGCQQAESFDMLTPARWPTRAPVMASHALIPAVTALPAATSHREASRLSTAASSHASDLDKWAWASLGETG